MRTGYPGQPVKKVHCSFRSVAMCQENPAGHATSLWHGTCPSTIIGYFVSVPTMKSFGMLIVLVAPRPLDTQDHAI